MTEAKTQRPLPKRAQKPAIEVSRDATVLEAAKTMIDNRVGAAVVLDAEGRPAGIFTERDVVVRVVLEKRDPHTTRVGQVMTSPVMSMPHDGDRTNALRMMLDKHIRHLPIVDAHGKVVAMLSMRHLLRAQIEDLEQAVDSLEAYAGADGPGG